MITTAFGTERFLRHYWQRRPVLLKQALPGFADPISAEELAGLACEEAVEARLVHHARGHWRLQSGPFKESDFPGLPDHDWTLLVQAVDQWVPGVRALLQEVPFLPRWRVDDVMISYATPGGGVGPHFDYYDVFLVQGQGRRRWQTGQACSSADLLRTGSGLKLLKEFHVEQDWILESGDVLYVPPGVAHFGTSLDCSLCYSVGFRAPSAAELLLGYADQRAETLPPDLRFRDPLRVPPLQTGEITESDRRQLRRLLRSVLRDESALDLWFGRHVTETRDEQLITPPRRRPAWQPTGLLRLHSAARLAWQQNGRHLHVFVNGDMERLPNGAGLRRCLTALSSGQALQAGQLGARPAVLGWCQRLCGAGILLWCRR